MLGAHLIDIVAAVTICLTVLKLAPGFWRSIHGRLEHVFIENHRVRPHALLTSTCMAFVVTIEFAGAANGASTKGAIVGPLSVAGW
jgi:hypothetical protein